MGCVRFEDTCCARSVIPDANHQCRRPPVFFRLRIPGVSSSVRIHKLPLLLVRFHQHS
ncbi:hypothetical protein BC834DRAFT_132452 [Gloeopeniophorella convolvens]|nr:hypothetical protein BC834DRAFT_132452 [Gloeopeniophorella convolvens]